jgi:dolichol-phosphate mannosyltransferase
MKSLVIIPTYNERENIGQIVPAVLSITTADTEVLIVDDNSPDGTADVVRQLQSQNSRVHLLLRQKKEGLGRAYIAGFRWGLENGFDILTEMDADFSHRPADLVKVLAEAQRNDFAVGSRYVPGGSTVNWGFLRKLISKGGSLYSRLILGFPLRDWTGGFNAWNRRVLEQMGLENVQSNGYSFQIELKYRALKLGFKGIEVPILFEDRRVGQSKMSLKIVLEAFYSHACQKGA